MNDWVYGMHLLCTALSIPPGQENTNRTYKCSPLSGLPSTYFQALTVYGRSRILIQAYEFQSCTIRPLYFGREF